jgi:hypothetical protein
MEGGTRTTVCNRSNEARRQVKELAAQVKQIKEYVQSAPKDEQPDNDASDRGESIANLMLAYRHLEDASMRLGKAIQAADGGVSVYDRATTVGA